MCWSQESSITCCINICKITYAYALRARFFFCRPSFEPLSSFFAMRFISRSAVSSSCLIVLSCPDTVGGGPICSTVSFVADPRERGYCHPTHLDASPHYKYERRDPPAAGRCRPASSYFHGAFMDSRGVFTPLFPYENVPARTTRYTAAC